MKVSIILPTYNEKENIFKLVREIKANLKGKDYEIIIIDDSSPDKTGIIAKRRYKKDYFSERESFWKRY